MRCNSDPFLQFKLNSGRPVAQSIPATEHSVMTSWPTEQAAIENMIENFGTGPFACVMDSYDYAKVCGATVNHLNPDVLPLRVFGNATVCGWAVQGNGGKCQPAGDRSFIQLPMAMDDCSTYESLRPRACGQDLYLYLCHALCRP
jgi:hypothetical protein